MLNKNGILAVLDRGITINWDDGPTLHRITAQVRFHTAASTTSQLMRLTAAHRQDDDTFVFMHDEQLEARWSWREMSLPDDQPELISYWVAQLAVTNHSNNDYFVEMMEVIRVDSAFHGQFNLGAPPGLWQCANDSVRGKLTCESWSSSGTGVQGFERGAELLVQPAMSNRSRPPALLIRAVDAPDRASPFTADTAEMLLELSGERFERLSAYNKAEGAIVRAGSTVTSGAFIIASGDDAAELHNTEFALPQ